MNILFVQSGDKPDYQCDMIFHGLNNMPGITVYTNKDAWFMYQGIEPDKLSSLYGKGFSIYNRLSVDKRIDDSASIIEKVRAKFYDCIIYGSVYGCLDYLDDVLLVYRKQEVFFIDGGDYDFSLSYTIKPIFRLKYVPSFYKQYSDAFKLSDKGFYFKRELRNNDRRYFFPISFAIPEENIITPPFPSKTRDQASIIPGFISTYTYDNETDYYNGYAISKYAVTTKKGGWDCLRHYEILANNCIPYFPNIEKIPLYTMHVFPKNLIIETNKLIEHKSLTNSVYSYYSDILYQYTKNTLTTKKLAEYVLSFL
jgi:hypothetical protein